MKKIILMVCLVFVFCSVVLTAYAMSIDSTLPTNIVRDEFSPTVDVDVSLRSFLNDVFEALKDSPEIYALSSEQLNEIEISSPYRILQYNDNTITAMNKVSYFIRVDDSIIGVATLAKYNDEYLWDFSTELTEQYTQILKTDKPFVLITEGSRLWVLDSDNTKQCLVDYSCEHNLLKQTSMVNERTCFEDINIAFQSCGEFSVDPNSFHSFQPQVTVSSNMTDEKQTTRSITPALMDLTSPWYHACNNACIASIVKTRLPSEYSNLNGLIVEETINVGRLGANKEYIATHMKNYYLPSSEHYTTYHSVSYTVDQFKNNCNANHLMIDVAYVGDVDDNLYHCVVTYDYIVSSSGGILVKFMDPSTVTYRMQQWSSGNFQYYADTTSSQTLVSHQIVISWY